MNKTATMLLKNDKGGFSDWETKFLVSTNAVDLVAFAKRAGKVMGFVTIYAVCQDRHLVVSISKDGYFTQKDFKTLMEMGFTEFHFHWAFAGKTWRFNDGVHVETTSILHAKGHTLAEWRCALGRT